MIPTLLLVADMRTANASATSELRLRMTDGIPSAEWMIGGSAGIGLGSRHWHLDLSYSPFFLVQEIFQPDLSPFFYHDASMALVWQGKYVRIALLENASHGFRNTADLIQRAPYAMGAIGAQPASVPIARGGPIQYVQSLTTLSLDYTPTPRWRFGLHGNMSLFGGVDDHARQFLPFQYGPSGGVFLSREVTRQDGVFIQADGGYSRTFYGPCLVPTPSGNLEFCEPDNIVGTAVAGWQRHLTAVTDAAIGGGVGFTRARLHQDVPYANNYYPAGTASYQYHLKKKHDERAFRVDAGLGPIVDVRSGGIDYRTQLTGVLNWKSDPYIAQGSFGFARSLQLPGTEEIPNTLLFVTSRLDYHLTRYLLVGGGLSIIWQHQDAGPPPPPGTAQQFQVFAGDTTSFLLSFGATVVTEPTRF